MGFDKLAAEIAGIPVLRHALVAFLAAEAIDEVIVVCPENRWRLLGENFPKPVKRVDGGASRQESVIAGLAALSPASRFVAIHDGARPLISAADINRCVAAAIQEGHAAMARRVTETLKRSDLLDFSLEGISREQLWFMETPQVFEVKPLMAAYADVVAGGRTVTDEVSVMEAVGIRVKFIQSTCPNIKITTPADLKLAQALLR
jgi:2-C-methyl-D-erythritol 4-phosphate cytidylyltransferase